MPQKSIHIICFDNPFPPCYGGVIDAFYMIKSLHGLGFQIHLHCFVDAVPDDSSEMQRYSEKLYFYKRNRNVSQFTSITPFSVKSRFDDSLLENLKIPDAPLLFEGLQSSYAVKKHDFRGRKKFLRLLNLENHYYKGLFKSETNLLKKIALGLESVKYAHYQKIFTSFETIFTLSVFETEMVKWQSQNSVYIPVFNGNTIAAGLSPMGKFALYHGDLTTADNRKAALFLVGIFKKIPDYPLVIASNNGREIINNEIGNAGNISYTDIKDESHLDRLLGDAHINVMASFQQSGTKLKAVNAIFKSRFCIINSNMVDDGAVRSLCTMAESEADYIDAVNALKNRPYDEFEKKKKVLENVLNDTANAQKMAEIISRFF